MYMEIHKDQTNNKKIISKIEVYLKIYDTLIFFDCLETIWHSHN